MTQKEIRIVVQLFLHDNIKSIKEVSTITGINTRLIRSYLSEETIITKLFDEETYKAVLQKKEKLKHTNDYVFNKLITEEESKTLKGLGDDFLVRTDEHINGEPMRKAGQNSAIITIPAVDTILSPNFDYAKYAEQYFNDTLAYRKGICQGYFEGMDEVNLDILFGDTPKEKVDTIEIEYNKKSREICNKYLHYIFVLQHQFERAFKYGKADMVNEEITQAIVEITKKHLLDLEILELNHYLNRQDYLKHSQSKGKTK